MAIPKPNDLFVDTSGWCSYLSRKDPLHTVTTRLVKWSVKDHKGLVTTNYVIAEVVALLSSRYHLNRNELINLVNAVKTDASVKIVYIEQSIDNEAWALLQARLDKEWSLVDASSFVVMRRFGMTHALTSDHHFTQAGFIRLPYT